MNAFRLVNPFIDNFSYLSAAFVLSINDFMWIMSHRIFYEDEHVEKKKKKKEEQECETWKYVKKATTRIWFSVFVYIPQFFHLLSYAWLWLCRFSWSRKRESITMYSFSFFIKRVLTVNVANLSPHRVLKHFKLEFLHTIRINWIFPRESRIKD